MSTIKSTKQKNGTHYKKHTSKNENAVLVLPPDLLQKLGINLENIQSPQDSSLEKNAGACSKLKQILLKTEATELQPEAKYIHSENKESSILETANLMKASVLLSPTFNSLKANIILDRKSNSESCIEEFLAESADNIQSEDHNKQFNNKDELKSDSMKCVSVQINDNKESICNEEMQSHNIKPIHHKNVHTTVPLETRGKGLDSDHIVHQKTFTESVNKINVQIQEEVFESGRILNKKESFHKNAIVPVTTDTIITNSKEITKYNESTSADILLKSFKYNVDDQVNKIEEVSDNILNNCSLQVENIESSVDKKPNSKEPMVETKVGEDMSVHENLEVQTIAIGNLYLPVVSKYKNDSQHKPSSAMSDEENNRYDSYDGPYDTQETEYVKYNLDSNQVTNGIDSCNCAKEKTCKCQDSIHNIDTTSSESKIPLGKVEEIAFYLSQVCYKGLNRQNSTTKNVNTTCNSKLCIQGVEKPGGVVENVNLNRNIKTYSRHKNRKLTNVISSLISYPEYNINSDIIDYKINDQNLYTAGTKRHNFCICGDFGSFINYDVDNSYEHIHFWKRNDAQCSVETLLSLYEDNNFEDVEKEDKEDNIFSFYEFEDVDKAKQFEISEDSEMGICWNYTANICQKGNHELIIQQKIQNVNHAECFLNKNEQSDYVETAYKGKRKRVDETSENELDCQKPDAKKATIAVKCGVCNCIVSTNEWDDHISEKHCFIAWREAQEIDLKNKGLLVKLNDRLHTAEKLICTFCELESYDVQKFIKHVSKCKERMYAGKSTNATEHSEIVIEVVTLPVDFEKNVEVRAPLNKSETNIIKERRRKIIKLNTEEFVENPQEKQIAPEGKTMLQVKIDEKQVLKTQTVLQRNKQKPVQEIPVLQDGTGQKQVTKVPVLQAETGLKLITKVPVLQNESEQIDGAEVPLLQVITEGKQVFEVPVLHVETDEIQVSEESVLQVESSEKAAGEVSVLHVETGENTVTCGVCNEVVYHSLWIEHITVKHNYIAWKDDEPPLDCEDEDEIRNYLNYIIKEIGELICKVCGLKRKFAKSYLKHIKNCQNTEQSDAQVLDHASSPVAVKTEKVEIENIMKERPERNKKVETKSTNIINTENIKKEKADKIKNAEMENLTVKCGVCKLELKNAHWMEHILKEHDYLAWQEGDPEIDVHNSQQVYDHLFDISKQNHGLTCKKCGLHRRYVKSYLKHIDTCEGVASNSLNESTFDTTTVDTLILDLSNDDEDTKCGVCKLDVEGKNWFNHVHLCHAYLAWKEGKKALDLENKEEIHCYLYLISKKYNGLICNKCGLTRKYVKAYLSHLESCNSKLLDSSIIVDGNAKEDSYECAVCAEKVDPNDWNNHAMKLHYNLAWVAGDYPIDTKNASVVEKQLKVYKQICGQLKCNECGTTRVSPMGFYAHIIQCGKSEEEIDKYKILCELCNNKYLFIYKRQHAVMHREQEYKELKLNERMQEQEFIHSPKTEQLSEKRRAAERARQFIEKSETFTYNCAKCGYGTDEQAELNDHVCGKVNYKEYVDSEDSAVIDSSDDESVDSAVDSNLSDEEIRPEQGRRKWHGDSSSAAAKVPRIPFAVKCAKSYLKQSAADYRNTFLTNGTLYPQWQRCSMELVADNQTATYMPTLTESCKVIIGRSDPVTYNQFEAKQQNGCSIFVGGCIQCISWAPPHVDDSNDGFGHFLAVACHNDVDLPRLDYEKTYAYSGLLQIWDFGDLSSTQPKFALGIAHDYGTIWAIDWCPSGARDVLSPSGSNEQSESASNTFLRLGLLAIACSNGSAYILSVPYPSSLKTSDPNVYKLTPVAELRLSRGKRTAFQATSISWSPQKDHETVMVGYSNGTVALYNLECNSPLLTESEGEVNILYPFQDERPHSTSITDVKTFPSSVGAGLLSSVSPTGSQAAQQRGAARIHKHIPANSAAFAPHWPAVMLSGNEIIVNQSVNELDFWGLGRRIGVVQKSCSCLHCGHVATFVPPVMKILTTHPAYVDLQKAPLAVFQMRPLSSRKRSKQKDDILQVKLEPLTYHDAVKSYALDFKLIKDLDKDTIKEVNRPRMQYPERFPLSDVPSMAFYPSQNHHRKLAVATHAGVIFIITDDNYL